jgi:hypothetical protein
LSSSGLDPDSQMGDLAVSAAARGFELIIQTVQKIHQAHVERKGLAQQMYARQQHFLHDFSFAGQPSERHEDYTIQEYCNRLRNLVATNLDVILGRGKRSHQAAHAFIATQAFHMGAMAGFPPQAPTAPPAAVSSNPPSDRVDC